MRGLGRSHRLRQLFAISFAVLMASGGASPPASASAPAPQTTRAVAPIVVTIDKPSDRESYPANAFVPVSAKAVSARRLTSLELWVDGSLIDQKAPLGFQNRYSAYFSWQPSATGQHVVVARAVDEGGAYADSHAVRVTATSPVNARLLLKAGQGESLRSVAERLKVPVDQIAGLNPGVDLNQALPEGFALFTPPSTGQASPASQSPQAGATRPGGSGGGRAAPSAAAPPPSLTLIDGKLVTAAGVERVYYYVSFGDGQWRRIPEDPNSFVSPLSLDELRAWEKTASPGILDRRAFEVAGKLGDLRAAAPKGESQLSVEAWGWRGGQLEYLGDFRQTIRPELLADPGGLFSASTDLRVCGLGTSCPMNDIYMGWTMGETNIEWGSENAKRDFRLKTSAAGWDGSAVWQVSTLPFTGGFDPAPPGLVAHGATKGSPFRVDFAHLGETNSILQPAIDPKLPVGILPTATPIGEESPLSSVFKGGLVSPAMEGGAARAADALLSQTRITYYVRVTPMAGNLPAAQPSNTIVIHRGPAEEGGVEIFNPAELNEVLPGIFDVEVLEFKTFNPSSSGCALITRNESTILGAGLYQVGEVYCPEVFKGLGGKPWYELLTEFVADVVDWISKTYNGLKGFVIDTIASAIPGCGEWCKGVLSAGLDAALIAAGVPPSLPSFAELGNLGEGYLLQYAGEQLGVDCSPGSLCAQGVKAALEEKKSQAMAGGSNEACMSKDLANAMGFEPMCLPPGVIGVPVEGSMPEPASMKVKVTRRAGSPEVSDEVYKRYQLGVAVTGVNNWYPAGKAITLPVNYPRDSSTLGLMCAMTPDEVKITLDSTLSGTLFTHPEAGKPVTIMPTNVNNTTAFDYPAPTSLPVTIPRLGQGESAELTIPLAPNQPFWIAGHQKAIQNAGGAVCYDDWYRLYQGGQLTASARVSCSLENEWAVKTYGATCELDKPAQDEIKVDVPW